MSDSNNIHMNIAPSSSFAYAASRSRLINLSLIEKRYLNTSKSMESYVESIVSLENKQMISAVGGLLCFLSKIETSGLLTGDALCCIQDIHHFSM